MVESLQILERVIAPDDRPLTPDLARCLIELQFSESDKARYLDLAARHNNGELSSGELAELKGFVEANTLLMILHAKAKRSLLMTQPAA